MLRIKSKYFVPSAFIISIILITYLFPRQGSFKYSFNEGRPWQYSLLTAPYDFPIYKSAEQLQEEQDSILQFYEPYYSINDEVQKNALMDFDADINLSSKLKQLSAAELRYIRNKLEQIYETGIMRSDDYETINESETHSFRLREGNMAKSKNIKDINTIRSAYEYILTEAPKSMDITQLRAADLNKYIRENIVYDESTSEKAKKEFIQQVSNSTGMIQAGQRIIDQGEIIDSQTFKILSSLKRVAEERSGGASRNRWTILGQFLLTAFMLGAFYLHLFFFLPFEYRNGKHVVFMLLLIVFFVALTAISVRLKLFNIYFIPYAIVTILVRTFIDSRTALFTSLITIILSSLMVVFPFEFIIIQFTVAIVSVFMLKELTERSQLIRSSFFILLTYILMYIGFIMYQEGSISEIDWKMLMYFLINFIFIMFSYSLVYVFEKSFGFISGVSLIELSNTNKPLLKELSERAPGTFQHSMQVSNLAMAAASKLGANSSLIRTGALYHDIGKISNPEYFTENQIPGNNPHEGLPYEESAHIIINHVRDGMRIAKKYNLPKQITDFIVTHHGESMPKYFYILWKKANPDKEIDESKFRYPGPNPFTMETAILMMADAVEAATRSLPTFTEENIRNLVEKIIDTQLEEGYFKNAPITFRDIQTVKDVFVYKLKTIYHSRVAYPELKK